MNPPFALAAVLGLSLILPLAWQPAAFAEPAPADGDCVVAKEDEAHRVTLLGVTKGVSFLETDEPVSDGGRVNGNRPVRWMRVAALVEQLGEQSAAVGLAVDAPEGVELVEPAVVEVEGRAVSMRSRGVKFMELDFAHLAPHIFPVKAPPAETDTNSQARVIVYTLSGDFRPSESATLRFRFRTGDEVRELVFQDIPIP